MLKKLKLLINKNNMTTPQIIIFSVLLIITALVFSNLIVKEKPSPHIKLLSFLIMLMWMMFTLIAILNVNKYYKQIKGKCPEYESVGETYKLKTQ